MATGPPARSRRASLASRRAGSTRSSAAPPGSSAPTGTRSSSATRTSRSARRRRTWAAATTRSPHSPTREGDEEELEELEDYDFEDEEQPIDEPATAGPRGVRGGRAAAEEHHRNRLVAFLIAVWAELQRVQWPDRKQLTQMTGIVLMFVLIAGGYLGLLDAIFSRLIQQII